MIPYEFYRVLHFTGIFLTLMSLGPIGAHMINGGTRDNFASRKWTGMLHGIGLTLIVLGGFGMLIRAYAGLPFPTWIYFKLVVWLGLGAMPALFYKLPGKAKLLWWLTLSLAVIGAMIALFKPFEAAAT